ncbi:KAP P-loop domain protein [Shewanella sp. MR-4]|uniref:KAP family P-loop NTPase fold protein n=1 Tax=Shewanella sp. (strain MR-4) TaxID=60480 RepID=UPI00005E6034|nr:P-loop NTPase fold protein [Shewanella sp. MR-4]ABI40744.1 KAP P-loop domain protein [Shewanella sp. MR-4]
MDISNHASKYKEWEQIYNWDTCKTNRREFGEFIAHFLSTDSRVINLDGIYGSGKTEFIKRLYIELAKRKHPVVYIDVWESDFSTNPLAVICSELLQQIEFVLKEKAPNGRAEDKRTAKHTLNSLKSKLGICLQYASVVSQYFGDSSIASELASTGAIISTTPSLSTITRAEEYVEIVQKNHVEAVRAMKEIKEYITFLSELIETIYNLKTPIIIMIDELDRCRPTYAIEVLEVIKHFFETKGCTFLVATNTEVLEQSIKAVYGSEFQAAHYLRRFFERKVRLPQVSTLDYLRAKQLDFDKYTSNGILLHPYSSTQGISELFAALFRANEIELRSVDQILNRFFTSLDYALVSKTTSKIAINITVLMVGLLEQHLDRPELSQRSNSNLVSTTLAYGNAKLNSNIKAMFHSVMTTKSQEQYNGRGKRIFPHEIEMLAIETYDFSRETIFANPNDNGEAITEIINSYYDSSCNFWLWENHQKVIELSGHIQ